MNIFENFKELQIEENFAKFKMIYSIVEKDKNKVKNKFTEWIYKKSVDKEIFYTKIDISNLEQNELREIDDFIKEGLNLFPNFFPHIILEKKHNYDRNNIKFNKKYTEKIENLLESNNTLEAVEMSMSKCFTTDHLTNPLYSCENDDLETIRKEIVSYLSKQVTIGDIIKEFKLQIRNNISKYLLEEEMNSLSKFMGIEVYFRTKKSTIYCKIYEKIEEKYKNFKDLRAIFIRNDINKILTNDSSNEGIERASERIAKYLKK